MKSNNPLLALSLALLPVGFLPAGRADAQEIALIRDIPPAVTRDCSAARIAAAAAQDPQEAARLLASAREAALLGDPGAARDLLARAAAVDTSAANIAFLHARTLEELGAADAAAVEYCRYLRLAPDAPDAQDVRQLVQRLAPPARPGIPDAAVARFRTALALADSTRLSEAEHAFSDVITAAPSWAAPYYNRAVLRMLSDRRSEARSDLEQFAALEPSAADPAGVGEWLNEPVTTARRYSPGAAFAYGLIPGAGHFYTGRPIAGTALLAIAGGAAAFGLMYQQRHVECLAVPQNNVCPADQVRAEHVERPYLVPAAGVAAAATLLSALDALRGARSRNAHAVQPGAASRVGSAVQVRPERIDIALFSLRF